MDIVILNAKFDTIFWIVVNFDFSFFVQIMKTQILVTEKIHNTCSC